MPMFRRSLCRLLLALGLLLLSFFLFLPESPGSTFAGESPLVKPLQERIALLEEALQYRMEGEEKEARGDLVGALEAYVRSYALYEDPLLKAKIRSLDGAAEPVPAGSPSKSSLPDLGPLRERIAYLESLLAEGEAREHPKLELEEPVEILRQRIDPEGGILKVEDPKDPLKGLEIRIPSGAWKVPVELTLERRTIKGHDFGPLFSPVSPLIRVKNPGYLAEEPLEISIPVNVPEGSFGMAFFYNAEEGRLEGLIPLASEKDRVVAATRRFSDVVVSVVSLDRVTGNLNIDTGFRPGYDDWQFTNYGSWLAPKGHCAGQSATAMWYFYEKRLKGERPLYGRYDNNHRGYGTLDFWRDDSWGYRLASVVQHEIDWDDMIYKSLRKLMGMSDLTTLMAFAYAMQLTEAPQFVGIVSEAPPSGHAIVAYRMEKDKLYVADPNYPGKERFISFEKGHFLPYNSGANAQAIASGDEVAYSKIGYFPLSRWMDWNAIGKRWEEVLSGKGKVGEDLFPPVKVEVLVKDGGRFSWIPLVDNYATDEDTTKKATHTQNGIRYDMTGRLAFRIVPGYRDMRVTGYGKTNFLARSMGNEDVLFRLNLREGENDFGFLLEALKNNVYEFYDFQRFIVRYNEKEPEPPEERFFFENRTFWITGSPFANDPSVAFPQVSLELKLEATGVSGDILPNTPEAERLEQMKGAVADAGAAIKEQMLQEMARMGVTLTESQLREALGQTLALSGLGGIGENAPAAPGRKVLVSGYAVEGKPLTLTLSVALDPVPSVPISLPEIPPLEGRVRVTKWFFTTGFAASPEIGGSAGKASVSWTPKKSTKIPESFSVDLAMYYSLDFYKRGTEEPWLDSGVPLRYDNLSVSFPVGICFLPLEGDSKP